MCNLINNDVIETALKQRGKLVIPQLASYCKLQRRVIPEWRTRRGTSTCEAAVVWYTRATPRIPLHASVEDTISPDRQ